MNELKIDPDPETEIVRAGSLLSSPSFLCIFDGDRAEIHTAASFSKAYPDYSEVTSSLEELSGENCFSLQKKRPMNIKNRAKKLYESCDYFIKYSYGWPIACYPAHAGGCYLEMASEKPCNTNEEAKRVLRDIALRHAEIIQKNESWDEEFDQSRPVFTFRDGQITIERVI